MFLEKSNSFLKGDLDHWVLALEGLEFKLFIDGFQFSSESFVKVLENEGEKLSEKFKNFEVMLFDCHFEIQSDELAHVSVSE